MSANLLLRVFVRVYRFYSKFNEPDPFDKSALTISTLAAFVINFIVATVYFVTRWSWASFDAWKTVGILLASIATGMFLFYKKKSTLVKAVRSFDSRVVFIDWLLLVALLLALSLGYAAFIVYRIADSTNG